jgi:hypothetical protein
VTATRTTSALRATVTAMSSGDSFIIPGHPPNKGQRIMSTIDASRDHGGSGAQTAGARPSHSRNVRRMLSYASVGPSGSAARRVGITLGLVIGSALLAASGAIHLQLWSMGYRTIPTIGPLFLIQGNRWRTSGRTPFAIAATTHCRGGRWIHDRHHRRVAAEHLFRTVRLHGYPGGTIRRPIPGSRGRWSGTPRRARRRACTWAESLRPRKSAH